MSEPTAAIRSSSLGPRPPPLPPPKPQFTLATVCSPPAEAFLIRVPASLLAPPFLLMTHLAAGSHRNSRKTPPARRSSNTLHLCDLLMPADSGSKQAETLTDRLRQGGKVKMESSLAPDQDCRHNVPCIQQPAAKQSGGATQGPLASPNLRAAALKYKSGPECCDGTNTQKRTTNCKKCDKFQAQDRVRKPSRCRGGAGPSAGFLKKSSKLKVNSLKNRHLKFKKTQSFRKCQRMPVSLKEQIRF